VSDEFIVVEYENWNAFFAKVVDETLKQIFKDEGARAIYEFLKKNAQLKLEDAAENPEVFSASLKRLMVSATQVIEQMILKNLYSKLGIKFEEKEGYEFSDYINEVKKSE
jgi:hypothetical protein